MSPQRDSILSGRGKSKPKGKGKPEKESVFSEIDSTPWVKTSAEFDRALYEEFANIKYKTRTKFKLMLRDAMEDWLENKGRPKLKKLTR